MANYDFDIGVIGGGAAGLTVAAGAARLGAKTLLIEKEKELGGDCLHFGCVPSKTLIKTAHVHHLAKNVGTFGLLPAEMPPPDFKKVTERIRDVISAIQAHDSAERFRDMGAKVEFGMPTFSDERSINLDGKTHSARKWVIATGSSPYIPPIEGLDKTAFITNRDLFSLNHLPESMIMLGAGPIAMEMAQAFSRLGSKIHVVQRSAQILSKEDRDMADEVMQVLRSEGVIFHLDSSIIGVNDLGSEREVFMKNGEGETLSLRAETLLVAIGRESNIGELGLEDIGVEFDEKGLKVNRRLQTTQKHIYAAGDVTGTHLFTHAAGYEGGVVISNAIFHLPKKTDYTFLPWCTFTDPELASIGMNEKRARASGIEYSVWTEEFKDNDRSLTEGAITGKIKMILDRKSKPIGVQILGPRAGELINEWVAILSGKVKLSALALSVHPYPTLGEINKRVAGNYYSSKIFSGRTKKLLRLFFRLRGEA